MLVEVKMVLDAKEFWSGIFGSGLETVPWLEIHFIDGADWETPVMVKVTIVDPDDSQEPVWGAKIVTVEDLADAASEIVTKYPHVNIGDMDVGVADMILQQAVLGKVVFG